MQRGSAVKHVLGNAHLDAAATAMAASQLAAADVIHLKELDSDLSDVYINADAADMAAPEHRIGLFDPIFDDMPDLVPCDDDGDAGYPTLVPTGILPHNPSIEREQLRWQVEALLMQAEQDDEFGGLGDSEYDSTISEIVQEFRLLGTCHSFSKSRLDFDRSCRS